VLERLSIAIGYFFDTMETSTPGLTGANFLVQAWAEADQDPAVREALLRRRAQLVTVGQMLLREAIASGEAPAWLDVDATIRAFLAALDGLFLQRLEEGSAWRRSEAERRALALVELLLAASSTSTRIAIEPAPRRPQSRLAELAAGRPRPS
jgi:hypothetical protein